jgi:hypothetical protein
MTTLVLITSIIKTPNTPLSYGTRSIYNSDQRFEQTKITIQTIKEKIPNAKIFIVECSDLDESQLNYFLENSDYFLNLYNDNKLVNYIHSNSKSLGEGTMTFCALDYLTKTNIVYDNLIKISGRYYLSENFNYKNFDNNNVVIKYINEEKNNVFTALYKLPENYVLLFKDFLYNNFHKMINYIGYEVLFAEFIKENCPNVDNYKIIGLAGYLSVSNDFYNG